MATSASRTDVVEESRRIRQEIEKLTEEQSKALQAAIYVGITSEQAHEYDARGKRIARLYQDLRKIEPAQ
jgi:hypothetical protein